MPPGARWRSRSGPLDIHDARALVALAAEAQDQVAMLQALMERMPTNPGQVRLPRPGRQNRKVPLRRLVLRVPPRQADVTVDRARYLADVGEAASDELVRASAKDLRSALIGDGADASAETGARRTDGPAHTWFVLLYSTHEVLPRTLMQSMPLG